MSKQQITTRGLAAIEATFDNKRDSHRALFIPYYPVGYPDYETSLQVFQALAQNGADVLEIGVPFSDPLADGPTIQAATNQALKNGTTLQMCIDLVQTLRDSGVQIPIILMGYVNPFMSYGFETLVAKSKAAGVDGFIVPDMPADEAELLQDMVIEAGMALPHFLAPTSNARRIRMVAEKASGYIYLVSVTGVTGTRDSLPPSLVNHIAEIRTVTNKPIAVGFGISTPDHAKQVGKMADGIIVGSAIVRAAAESVEAAATLSAKLSGALEK